MEGHGDLLERVLAGQGPEFRRLLEMRTRALAAPAQEREIGAKVLVCRGRAGRWALPLNVVRQVEGIPPITPVPGKGGAILGLVLLGARRLLLADLDSLAAQVPPRPLDRPGHSLALAGVPLALATDRVEAIGESTATAPAVLPDGAVLLDPAHLEALIMGVSA